MQKYSFTQPNHISFSNTNPDNKPFFAESKLISITKPDSS
jgi:hypothetical protein